MWLLRLEQWLFYKLLRREIKRMNIGHLQTWLTWFQLDLSLKRRGLEHW